MSGRLDRIMASTKPLITFLIDDELLKRLDDFRFGYRLSSRGAAIRFLLEAALDQDPIPEPRPQDPAVADHP